MDLTVYQALRIILLASHCLGVIHEGLTIKPPESQDPPPQQVTDHRFFLQQIFHKYGNKGQMTFEGFEHLLESLGLGNIIIQDHDLAAHKEDDNDTIFKNTHDTHEHSMQSDMPGNGEKDASNNNRVSIQLPLPKHLLPTSASRSETVKPTSHHDHGGSHAHGHTHGHTGHADGHTDHRHQNENNPIIHDSEQYGHVHRVGEGDGKPNTQLPELFHNLTALVEQHKELTNQQPSYMVKQCLSPMDILLMFNVKPESSLDASTFLHVCPAIIYELDQRHCTAGVHRRDHDDLADTSVSLHQWLYAGLAVLLISLCGLFSVAVIPIMQKMFYQTMLQFLVGLAIGSLSGDALLHLMPHAMLGGEEESKGHGHGHEHAMSSTMEEDSVWRGMSALGGIYFFFFAERLLNALTTYRRKKKLAKVFKNSRTFTKNPAYGPIPSTDDRSVGQKLSQYRRDSQGIQNGIDGKEAMQMLPDPSLHNEHPRKESSHSVHEVGFHGRSSFSAEPGMTYADNGNENYVVTIAEHHGHGHGHSHEIPQSVSAVAWMVIMGDGLHNFCDGLAIGAAFASGVAGGISTTVAVFCHELPHELGDFAMLLKTGMKVKQALFYNALSSVLCFIGMVIGVSLGNITSATSWVFAGTAGMFLYIALVDMLPELSTASTEPGSTASYQLAVQVLGISIGISVMLLIAIYEHDLKLMVS